MLCATIVRSLQQRSEPDSFVGFCFCDRSNTAQSSLMGILANILWQASQSNPSVLQELLHHIHVAEAAGRSRLSSADSPLAMLCLSLQHFKSVYVIVDGLDECLDVVEILDALLDLTHRVTHVRLLILSRDMPRIRSRLQSSPEIEITSEAVSADIHRYVYQSFLQPCFDHVETSFRRVLAQRISNGANGCFLWAHLMLSSAKRASSRHELEQMSESLPEDLTAAYAMVISTLCLENPKRRRLAAHALRWICFALCPLTWAELRTALAVSLHDEAFDPTRVPFEGTLFALCAPLVRYQRSNGTYEPIHASFCEFLTRPAADEYRGPESQVFFSSTEDGNGELGRVCLKLLTFTDTFCIPSATGTGSALAKYASLNWPQHVLRSRADANNTKHVHLFLQSQNVDTWMKTFLFHEPSLFPLQYMLQQRRRLLAWGNFRDDDPSWDWSFRILELLLSLGNVHKQVDCLTTDKNVPVTPRISYFERLMVMRDLVREFARDGRLIESVSLLESAIAEREESRALEDPSNVWLLNSLGLLYDQQNRSELAAKTQEQALAIQLELLGLEDSQTIWTRNELGRMYRHLGRLSQAEACHREALRAQSCAISDTDDNLEVTWTISTLGRVYRQQQRLQLALECFHEALRVRQKLLGDDHPHCLWLLGDIAQSCFEAGDMETALGYHELALERRRHVLGPEHPDTMWTMNNLGTVLAALSCRHDTREFLTRAEEVQRSAYEGQRKVLGDSHPHTVWTGQVLKSLTAQLSTHISS